MQQFPGRSCILVSTITEKETVHLLQIEFKPKIGQFLFPISNGPFNDFESSGTKMAHFTREKFMGFFHVCISQLF